MYSSICNNQLCSLVHSLVVVKRLRKIINNREMEGFNCIQAGGISSPPVSWPLLSKPGCALLYALVCCLGEIRDSACSINISVVTCFFTPSNRFTTLRGRDLMMAEVTTLWGRRSQPPKVRGCDLLFFCQSEIIVKMGHSPMERHSRQRAATLLTLHWQLTYLANHVHIILMNMNLQLSINWAVPVNPLIHW